MSAAGATFARLRESVLAAANPDGGWGYYAGTASRIEPTVWALLAQAVESSNDSRHTAALTAHLAFLIGRQTGSGLLAEGSGLPPNMGFNGLAAFGLASLARGTNRTTGIGITVDARFLAALLDGIVQRKGIRLPASSDVRQDNTLQGWPWIDGTFSWLEPTCWCLLALKRSIRAASPRGPHEMAVGGVPDAAGASGRHDLEARIGEAERLLIDRCCSGGGWNFGNSNVMGQDLHAYVPTTALGLLAMQDRRDHPAVARSLTHLHAARLSEVSGLALALTAICLRIYGIPAIDVEERLVAQFDRTGFLGNTSITALAWYSLNGERHGLEAFRL